jgi:hypothetical protein
MFIPAFLQTTTKMLYERTDSTETTNDETTAILLSSHHHNHHHSHQKYHSESPPGSDQDKDAPANAADDNLSLDSFMSQRMDDRNRKWLKKRRLLIGIGSSIVFVILVVVILILEPWKRKP